MSSPSANPLRIVAAQLLNLAQRTDGLRPYLISHRHEYGDTLYLAHFPFEPTEDMAASVLQSKFEPDRDECLTISGDVSPDTLAGIPPAGMPEGRIPLYLPIGFGSELGGHVLHVARLQLDGDLIMRLDAACTLCSAMKIKSLVLDDVEVEVLTEGKILPARIHIDAQGFHIRTDAGHDTGVLHPNDLRRIDFCLPAFMGNFTPENYALIVDTLAESIDLASVAEWVGLHYRKNFDSEPLDLQLYWIMRYIASHAEPDAQEPQSVGDSTRPRA